MAEVAADTVVEAAEVDTAAEAGIVTEAEVHCFLTQS
jgi:hypothetical protein